MTFASLKRHVHLYTIVSCLHAYMLQVCGCRRSVKTRVNRCVSEGGGGRDGEREWLRERAYQYANEVRVMTLFVLLLTLKFKLEKYSSQNTATFMSSFRLLAPSRRAETSWTFPCFGSDPEKARQMLFIVHCLSFLRDRDTLIQMSTITISPCFFFLFFLLFSFY